MKQDKSGRAKSPHEHDFVSYVGEPDLGQDAETDKKQAYSAREHKVTNALLTVPLDCTVFDAHKSNGECETKLPIETPAHGMAKGFEVFTISWFPRL